MAAQTKTVQLDLFRNEKAELESQLKKEIDDSTQRKIRNLFHQTGDHNKRLDVLEMLVGQLIDAHLEKSPE
jgi:t-SNARE complex subunit (syntaxin)